MKFGLAQTKPTFCLLVIAIASSAGCGPTLTPVAGRAEVDAGEGAAAGGGQQAAPAAAPAAAGQSAATAGNGASTFAAASMDTLFALAPARLKAVWPNIAAAAATYQLQPQLLVAIAMVESAGGSDQAAYSNGGGMFQFTDSGTWAHYGQGGDRLNDADEVEPAAHYMSDNLKATNNDLSAALRLYNGPISAGGASDYQDRIKAFMLGRGF